MPSISKCFVLFSQSPTFSKKARNVVFLTAGMGVERGGRGISHYNPELLNISAICFVLMRS